VDQITVYTQHPRPPTFHRIHRGMATITPTHTLRGDPRDPRGVWEFAVPLDGNEVSFGPSPEVHRLHYGKLTTEKKKNNPQNYNSQFENSNGTLQHRSSRTQLSPQSNGNTIRSKSSDVALGQDNEPQTNSSTKGTKRLVRKKSSQATSLAKPTKEDESNWIHRDKLAQIESRELEEFSMRLGRRISSRSELTAAEQADKRQRLASPIQIDETFEDEGYNEEDASSSPKSYNANTGNRPAANSVNSRIPIPRSFSGSVPHGDLPNGSSRSRSNSMGMSHSPEQSPISTKPTRRQGSSQEYNDDLAHSSPDSPPPNYRTTSNTSVNNSSSPQKKPGSKTRRPNQRTPSQQKVPQLTPIPTSTSSRQAPNEQKRPGTSSGRPGTSHRTEGDPPWIASMYKPDPRLPPDQQMLPTHAKRLAQQQWEQEGKTGTVYDRDFRLLNDTSFPDKPPSHTGNTPTTSPLPSPGLSQPMEDYRLHIKTLEPPIGSPLGSPRSNTSSPRPGTSDTHGGYRTMPSIARAATPLQQEHEQQEEPRVALGTLSVTPMGGFDDYDEELDKKKGCGCCVIM
jgi:hypothetical protein